MDYFPQVRSNRYLKVRVVIFSCFYLLRRNLNQSKSEESFSKDSKTDHSFRRFDNEDIIFVNRFPKYRKEEKRREELLIISTLKMAERDSTHTDRLGILIS
ncbi:hypothetical protein NPIL_227261 [Nephila pilipes]|uniref:Uncharacterized protein n=1 Tax=Nephila pilipes TaxID=299642 RepID=A0A8X6MTQ8_NEPPI|nr:hypothetical protein NPIL_227261 [Nephila pilipes]